MKKVFLLSLILSVTVFTSCINNADNSFAGYDKTDSGLYYKFYNDIEGNNPQIMDIMDVFISCKINDTLVIMPENRNLIQLGESMFKGDIYEGLSMMSIGDSASFIVRTDSTLITLFGMPVLPPNVTADDILKFEVKLNDFYPKSELKKRQIGYIKEAFPEETVKAENELEQYLKDNNITATPTETGLYYVKTKDGNGENPQPETLVKVHYTGKLLDGTVFDSSEDSNEPFQFVLGVGQVISGWDEGIQLMSKGEKGVLYIPFYLAYVDRQAGIIPPFSNLIFEVELVDF